MTSVMTRSRCYSRKKMMGRGADGGCGAAERPCRPVHRASLGVPAPLEESTPKEENLLQIDVFSQARKALCERSPYDVPEDGSVVGLSVPTLPSGLANLLKHSDSRKNHKKTHANAKKKSSKQGEKVRGGNIWVETEDYFRSLALPDIDALFELCSLRSLGNGKCSVVPCTRNKAKADVYANVELSQSRGKNLTLGAVKVGSEEDAKELVKEELIHFEDIDSMGPPLSKEEREFPAADSCGSLEWLLGSRSRVLLSSERPSKKRKLLGSAAGLEKLLIARPCNRSLNMCHFCSTGDTMKEANKLIVCSSCKVAVHQKCYGVQEDVDKTWLCSWCGKKNDASNTLRPCVLCPQHGGALKPMDKSIQREESEFSHLFCALWVPELYIHDMLKMQPIINREGMKETRRKLICSVCKVKRGACVRCSHASCRTLFHPICAREGSHRMEVWGKFGCEEVELRAFCSKHSDALDNNCSPGLEDIFAGKDESSVANPVVEALSLNKALKHGLKNGDTVAAHVDTHDTSSGKSCDSELLDVEIFDPKSDAPVASDSYDAQLDVSVILRKLIERGKANIKDVASEMDMSADSLSAKLSDYRLVPDLRCKIIKWLRSHAYIVDSLKNLKVNINPFIRSKDVVRTVDDSDGLPVSDYEIADSVTVKSVPPRRRTRSNSTISRENNVMRSSDAIFRDNGAMKVEVNDNQLSKGVHHISKSSDIDATEKMITTPAEPCDTVRTGLPNSEESSYSNISRVEASLSASVCCDHQSQHSVCNGMDSKSIELNVGQFVKTRKLEIIDLSPEDEVEGEIIYYQRRLLGNSMAREHLTDSLASRVVKNIPEEIEAARDKRWDAVLVSHYLKKLQDAKKQGRKERRHKEAQAVLAAASAATVALSRVSSLRKESLEDSGNQKLLKLNALSGSADTDSQPMPGPKETVPRVTFSKVPSDEYLDGLQSLPDVSKDHHRLCDICRRIETIFNPILICSGCKVSVHLDCYRNVKESTGPWTCELCEDMLSSRSSAAPSVNFWDTLSPVVQCGFCGGTTGAFRKSVDGQWVHAFCAEWVLDSIFRRGQVNPVEGMETVSKGIDTCSICCRKQGVCIKCNYGHCRATFHPSCARSAGFYMNMRMGGGKLQHKAYCEKHSFEQRAKAETQRHGTEELKNMKQMRVELERLRLLCERIVKREKLKRELVLSSHDILTCKKDHVIRSVLIHNPLSSLEVSSESATTCLKGQTDGYRSCSEVVQRSDGITIANIPAKNQEKVPALVDSDQRTDDSSTSQPLFPQRPMPTERSQFSGKQIPLKYSLAARNVLGIGEWSSKLRKPIETLGKELVMTSDEATIKNSRLPKGYCYVPVDSLPKEKQITRDARSGERVEHK